MPLTEDDYLIKALSVDGSNQTFDISVLEVVDPDGEMIRIDQAAASVELRASPPGGPGPSQAPQLLQNSLRKALHPIQIDTMHFRFLKASTAQLTAVDQGSRWMVPIRRSTYPFWRSWIPTAR